MPRSVSHVRLPGGKHYWWYLQARQTEVGAHHTAGHCHCRQREKRVVVVCRLVVCLFTGPYCIIIDGDLRVKVRLDIVVVVVRFNLAFRPKKTNKQNKKQTKQKTKKTQLDSVRKTHKRQLDSVYLCTWCLKVLVCITPLKMYPQKRLLCFATKQPNLILVLSFKLSAYSRCRREIVIPLNIKPRQSNG